MWQLFWLQNIHYVLEVFVAFLMITSAWIYLDGWLVDKRAKTLLRSLGFFVLAIWAFMDSTPETTRGLIEKLTGPVGLAGFSFLLLSLLIDPIPVKPGGKPIGFFSRFWEKSLIVFPPGLAPFVEKLKGFFSESDNIWQRVSAVALPILVALASFLIQLKIWMFVCSLVITILLWLHYKRGIQSEWKYFYLGFLGITVSLGLSIFSLWQNSSNVLIAKLVSEYQPIWMLEHLIKLLGAIGLGAWAWGFIRFRIFPQIFSSFVALSFIIFVTMTIIYTGFLLNKSRETAVKDLETNVRTLDFAIRKIKDSAILAARIASTNPQVRESMRLNDRGALFKNLNALMFENETDFMIATNVGGEVLMRAEDKEHYGDSISEDPVVWRALNGKAVVTTFVEQGITLPTVSIRAASPVVDTSETGEQEITGVIVTGFLLDTAFVDGIKKITGLDITVFANDTRSASTFTVPGSQFRLIGTKELDQKVIKSVLKKSQSYTGSATVLNQSFLAAYIPILDVEETAIGMFFTGRSQSSILALASQTMRLTFLISIALMAISILPLRWLALFISHHQEV